MHSEIFEELKRNAEKMHRRFNNLVETEELMERIIELNPGWLCSLYDPNRQILVNKWAPAFCALIGMLIGFLIGASWYG